MRSRLLDLCEGFRKDSRRRRQETVKAASTALNWVFSVPGGRNPAARKRRSDMSVVVYIVLTVAVFALLGLIQKLVEGL
jgi:hypothetical protein